MEDTRFLGSKTDHKDLPGSSECPRFRAIKPTPSSKSELAGIWLKIPGLGGTRSPQWATNSDVSAFIGTHLLAEPGS